MRPLVFYECSLRRLLLLHRQKLSCVCRQYFFDAAAELVISILADDALLCLKLFGSPFCLSKCSLQLVDGHHGVVHVIQRLPNTRIHLSRGE